MVVLYAPTRCNLFPSYFTNSWKFDHISPTHSIKSLLEEIFLLTKIWIWPVSLTSVMLYYMTHIHIIDLAKLNSITSEWDSSTPTLSEWSLVYLHWNPHKATPRSQAILNASAAIQTQKGHKSKTSSYMRIPFSGPGQRKPLPPNIALWGIPCYCIGNRFDTWPPVCDTFFF